MRIVLTGASGQLGAYLLARLIGAGHDPRAWSHRTTGERLGLTLEPVELADPEAVRRALDAADPDAVLHAGAVAAAEAVRLDPDRARQVNVEATRTIADWCQRRDRRMLFTSTDLVFDGSKPWNRESDAAEPILAYGRTKREAEPAVLAVRRGMVARVSLLYGFSNCGRNSFFDNAFEAIRRGEPRSFFADEYRTPLDLATAAEALVGLLETESIGLIHVGGIERVSRHELMRRSATALGLDADLVRPNLRADAPLPEPRPADVSLDTARLASLLPGLTRFPIEQTLADQGG